MADPEQWRHRHVLRHGVGHICDTWHLTVWDLVATRGTWHVPVVCAGQRVPHAPEGGAEEVVELLRVAHTRQPRTVHYATWVDIKW